MDAVVVTPIGLALLGSKRESLRCAVSAHSRCWGAFDDGPDCIVRPSQTRTPIRNACNNRWW